MSLDPTKEVGDHQTQEEAKEMATKAGELRMKQWPIENDTVFTIFWGLDFSCKRGIHDLVQ